MLDHGRHPRPGRDDDATFQAFAYRRALKRCRDNLDRNLVAEDHPALAQAHSLYTTGDAIARAEVQGRLLANQDDDVIASHCGILPEAVKAYHDVFFFVRPLLKAEFYILANVIANGRYFHGLQPDDHEALVQLFGFTLGPDGVDRMLAYIRNPPVFTTFLDHLDLEELRDLSQRIITKVMILSLTTPAAAMDPATWLELGERFGAVCRSLPTAREPVIGLASTRELVELTSCMQAFAAAAA